AEARAGGPALAAQPLRGRKAARSSTVLGGLVRTAIPHPVPVRALAGEGRPATLQGISRRLRRLERRRRLVAGQPKALAQSSRLRGRRRGWPARAALISVTSQSTSSRAFDPSFAPCWPRALQRGAEGAPSPRRPARPGSAPREAPVCFP